MGTPLTSVAGIGPAAAAILARHGFDSAERLAASRVEALVEVPGFGPVRAAATLRAARALVGEVATDRNQDKKKKGKKGGKGNKAKRAASQGKGPGKSKSPRKGKNGDKKRARKGGKGGKGKKAKKGKKSKGANKR